MVARRSHRCLTDPEQAYGKREEAAINSNLRMAFSRALVRLSCKR
jgi:hypothetical protein